jgi:hypothetical protein
MAAPRNSPPIIAPFEDALHAAALRYAKAHRDFLATRACSRDAQRTAQAELATAQQFLLIHARRLPGGYP